MWNSKFAHRKTLAITLYWSFRTDITTYFLSITNFFPYLDIFVLEFLSIYISVFAQVYKGQLKEVNNLCYLDFEIYLSFLVLKKDWVTLFVKTKQFIYLPGHKYVLGSFQDHFNPSRMMRAWPPKTCLCPRTLIGLLSFSLWSRWRK